MDPLIVDGWTVVSAKTYSAELTRLEIANGHGKRLSLMMPRALTTYEEMAPLIRARVQIAGELPPEGPPGPLAV